MKKNFIISAAALLLAITLTACGEEASLLQANDYELNLENNTTSKGITVGDTPEAFLEAYGTYEMEVSIDGGIYQSLPKKEIHFTESI